MGRHLSPRYGQVILVSGCPVLTAVNWWQHLCLLMCNQLSPGLWAPKVARKCESKHWYVCGADGRPAAGRAVYGHVITKFSRMVGFTYPWWSAGALRAPELRYELQCYENPMKMSLKTRNAFFRALNTDIAFSWPIFQAMNFPWKVDNGFHGSWNFHEISRNRVHEPWKVGVL